MPRQGGGVHPKEPPAPLLQARAGPCEVCGEQTGSLEERRPVQGELPPARPGQQGTGQGAGEGRLWTPSGQRDQGAGTAPLCPQLPSPWGSTTPPHWL